MKTTNTFDWSWQSYKAWADPQKTIAVNMADLARGQVVYFDLYAKNTSSSMWYNLGNNPIQLGTWGPLNRSSILCNGSWRSCNRPALMNEPGVSPGQTASFSFSITAPGQIGEYREYVKPVAELNAWMRDDINHVYLKVTR